MQGRSRLPTIFFNERDGFAGGKWRARCVFVFAQQNFVDALFFSPRDCSQVEKLHAEAPSIAIRSV